ncbi:MAG: Plug domain-containing protein, partial [Thiomicrorhabdus sp.]|nr:Plug domain-containing protein [Thiomicrorhabdus sp.]
MSTSVKNSIDARYLGYLLIVILLSMESTFAANIIVVIKERGSGVPIEGATVVINDGDAYDETGETGKIEFSDIDSPNKIKVLAAGFETLEASVTKNQKTITLYLEPFFVDGEGLNVSAERLVEKASKLTLTSVELIKAAGSGGDPLKAITALPGIIATSEGSAEVYMRGSNGNENITWVNNTPVGYLYHFGGFQSTINPALIED